MKKRIQILKARYLKEYTLELIFSDKKIQLVDFRVFLESATNPEISKYLKIINFKKFKLVDGDLMWGDFDLLFPIMDLYRNRILPENSSKLKNVS